MEDFLKNYNDIRVFLFLSGLSIGTFLLSMKSFILKTLKEEMYEKPSYQEHIRSLRLRKPEERYYGPLRKLSGFISKSIFLSVSSSFLNLSTVFFNNIWWLLIVMFITVISWFFLFIVLNKVDQNWNRVLNLAEGDAEEKMNSIN